MLNFVTNGNEKYVCVSNEDDQQLVIGIHLSHSEIDFEINTTKIVKGYIPILALLIHGCRDVLLFNRIRGRLYNMYIILLLLTFFSKIEQIHLKHLNIRIAVLKQITPNQYLFQGETTHIQNMSIAALRLL